MTEHVKARVRLNGTDVNPFHRWGLKRNPFPQHGKAELDYMDQCINELAADPIPNKEALAAKLKRMQANPEFTRICLEKYEQGKMVDFVIEFDL